MYYKCETFHSPRFLKALLDEIIIIIIIIIIIKDAHVINHKYWTRVKLRWKVDYITKIKYFISSSKPKLNTSHYHRQHRDYTQQIERNNNLTK